jgi:uncharacterized membrane protein YfcA
LTLVLGFEMKRASATSLVVIVITATTGAIGYAFHDGVIWLGALALSIGSTAGSYVGARLLKFVPSVYLMWAYAILLLGVTARLAFSITSQGTPGLPVSVPEFLAMLGLGLFAGLLAGLLGVGGGILVIPLLVLLFGMTNFEAKGTSLVMMIPAGIIGTRVNLMNNRVDVRSGVIIGLVAALVSYAGVAVSLILPSLWANLLFAVLMIYTAIQFIIRAIRTRNPIA